MSIVESNQIVTEGYKISLRHKLQFYKGDRLNLAFSLSNSLVTRISSQEVVDGVLPLDNTVITAYMLLGGIGSVTGTIIENNRIIFKLLPEHQVVGITQLQIVLSETLEDGTKEILHTPPFDLEIREPLGEYEQQPDDYARVNYAIVGKSMVASVESISDSDISVTAWKDGDIITAPRLNAMLDGEFMDEDWTIKGVSVGAYRDGDVIKKGMSAIEIIKNMTTQEEPPKYTSPRVTITSSITGIQEIGTTITPTITVSYNQNDGGAITRIEVRRNNLTIATLTTVVNPYRFIDTITLENSQSITYHATIYYEEGEIKNSNLGNPYPTGHIMAGGTTGSSGAITPCSPIYYGFMDNIPSSADEIKALNKRIANNKSFTYNNINMVNSHIVYAYPSSLGTISSIKDGNGFEYRNSYSLTTITIDGIVYSVLYLVDAVSVTNFTQVFS